jgi:hypothetical protein
MSAPRIYKILAVTIVLALLVPACGSAQSQESIISTAVAQTVEAQDPTETLTVPTPLAPTDTPPVLATFPVPATATQTPQTGAAVDLCTADALLAGETIPDGTILQPGAVFTKTWTIKNNGTCTWNANWQLVYYDGDLMGGATAYKLPDQAEPGETVEIPVILKAPVDGGKYTGQWMLKSPWGKVFGVGQYSVPVSVSIVVGSATPENKRTETVYGVTAVTYSVDRRCTPANTFYTITANITSNGPVRVEYMWMQSDLNNDEYNVMTFTEATTKGDTRVWSQGNGTVANPRWVQIIVTSPVHQAFGQFMLPDLCKG